MKPQTPTPSAIASARPVKGYPQYSVTPEGQLLSFKYHQPRALRPKLAGRGYLAVSLSSANKARTRYIHQLVCEAFHGPRADGHETRHLNCVKHDNRAVNMAWGTSKENAADNHAHGKYECGSARRIAKLRECDIPVIRARIAAGHTHRRIAADYGVAYGQISSIKSGRTWRHVA